MFSGIPRVNDSVNDLILANWEKAMSEFVQMGCSHGVLIDKGHGLWVQLSTFWNNKGFTITEDPEGAAQVLDRHILRQKVLLQLQIDRKSMKVFEGLGALSMQALQLSGVEWKDTSSFQESEENVPHIYDPSDEEEEPPDNEDPEAKDSLLQDYGTIELLRLTYETEGEGQLRHWIQNDHTNSCEGFLNESSVRCGKVDQCFGCNANKTEHEDQIYNMSLGLTAAKLQLYSSENKWTKLPDHNMFDFILELNARLQGSALRK
jgi:hypothetical protein